MINERTYSTKLAIERIKDYCSIEDKCQLDIIKKMEEWGILKISQDHILEILIKEKYFLTGMYPLFLGTTMHWQPTSRPRYIGIAVNEKLLQGFTSE